MGVLDFPGIVVWERGEPPTHSATERETVNGPASKGETVLIRTPADYVCVKSPKSIAGSRMGMKSCRARVELCTCPERGRAFAATCPNPLLKADLRRAKRVG